jgi:predicted transposase/invertase (TIGR01784 family)
MEFIDGKSKGVMEMLAAKNEQIKKAFNLLEIISQDEKARMIYEARQAEIHDQVTRLESAREEGKEEGKKEGIKELAIKLLNRGIDINVIIETSGLSRQEIEVLKAESERN